MKLVRTVCVMVCLFILMGCVKPKEITNVISEKNEFGGKTMETTYPPRHDKYKLGQERLISYRDGNGKEKKMKYYIRASMLKKAVIKVPFATITAMGSLQR